MTTYTVTPSQTQDQTIARFELSPALEIVQASKYNNIDEAKDAPLVQQMFYLPFVKSVVLKKEALEIERFNILEWKDVLEDVSLEIENYLNKGGVVMNETQPLKESTNHYLCRKHSKPWSNEICCKQKTRRANL